MLLKSLGTPDAGDPIRTADGAATTDAPPVFDECSLMSRLMNDRDLASTVVGAFLQDYPVQLALLSKRLSEADADGARRQAHKMKGAAASISAGRLRMSALEIERAAGVGELQSAVALMPRMTEEFEQLKTTLQLGGWLGRGVEPGVQP